MEPRDVRSGEKHVWVQEVLEREKLSEVKSQVRSQTAQVQSQGSARLVCGLGHVLPSLGLCFPICKMETATENSSLPGPVGMKLARRQNPAPTFSQKPGTCPPAHPIIRAATGSLFPASSAQCSSQLPPHTPTPGPSLTGGQ